MKASSIWLGAGAVVVAGELLANETRPLSVFVCGLCVVVYAMGGAIVHAIRESADARRRWEVRNV